jgi:serine/threonine protein kinase
MEFVSGGSLTNLIEKPISDRFKCKLVLDVARGMAFLHSMKIYHRDIKPDNVASPLESLLMVDVDASSILS